MRIPGLYLAEPYRFFFPLGWTACLFGVSYWIVVSAGLTVDYSPLYHGLIQMELFCSAFAAGFLLTALPKFLSAKPASRTELFGFLTVYLVLACAVLKRSLVVSQISFMLFLMLIAWFGVTRVRERATEPPQPFLLVAFGIAEGALGALFLIWPLTSFPLLGQRLIEQGMFLSLSLGIGSFLGPKLMGISASENALVKLSGKSDRKNTESSFTQLIVLLVGVAVLGSFFIETGWHREIGLSVRALAAAMCLLYFNVRKIPRNRTMVAVATPLALWCMPLSLALAVFAPSNEAGMMHLMYIGGFGVLIFTIGAQVVSSHGGVQNFWHAHRRGAALVGLLAGIATAVRMIALMFPDYYFPFLLTSGAVFNAALILWGLAVLRHVADTPAGAN